MTFDVLVNVPATPTGATAPPSLLVYDRELSLSDNSSVRDAGMLAYISVNGATLPAAGGFGAAVARADTCNSLVAGQTFSVLDPSKGVLANDTNVFGAQLLTAPTNDTVTLNANGTFTYVPSGTATTDSFTYCGNGSVTAGVCSSGITAYGDPRCGDPRERQWHNLLHPALTSNESTYLKIPSPGVLAFCRDAAGYPLNVAASPAPAPANGTGTTGATLVSMDPNGGFVATVGAHTGTATASLTFSPQNSQGTLGTSQNVTLNFPAPSKLQVNVVDAAAYQAAGCTLATAVVTSSGVTCGTTTLAPVTDYRSIIEEDKTFWVDPNCTTNNSINTPGCPKIVGPSGQSTIPAFAVNFHQPYGFRRPGLHGDALVRRRPDHVRQSAGLYDPWSYKKAGPIK